MPKLFGDGILVVGDAAGMALNLGLTVRGMEFAIASGAMAAETVKIAKRGNDYSASTLSKYQDLLKESFVWKDLNTFKHAPDFLDNPRFFNRYPQFACDIMENLMGMGEGGKEKLSSTALKQLSSGLVFSMIRDAIGLRRI
jgi:electron transfer flavoprotein-quinone oxidoreductase